MLQPVLVRRKDVLQRFGVSLYQLRRLERAGQIKPRRLHLRAHPYYVAAEVERVLVSGGSKHEVANVVR